MRLASTQRVTIEEFCITGSGGTPSRSNAKYYGGDIPWVKSGELRESIIWKTEETITEEALRKSSAKIVPQGAILLAMYGATVGRLAMLGVDAATNQAVCNIRPDPSKADAKYLYRALEAMVPELISQATGGAQPNISQEKVRKTRIFLPPLDEQKRIAAILDKADALRAKRRQAIALLDSLTQSIFLEMFGDLTQWQTLKLAEFTDEFRYGTSEKSQAVGHPTLRIPNVVGGSVSLSDLKFVPVSERELGRLRLQDGDILFVRTNGNKDYVGRSAVVTNKIENGTGHVLSDFIYASYLIRARVKQDVVNPHFLQAFLSGAAGRKMLLERAKTSAGQYNINTEGLGSINIPIPPIGKQDAFQSTIEKMSENLDACRLNLGQVDVLFSSLQYRAFTGQL